MIVFSEIYFEPEYSKIYMEKKHSNALHNSRETFTPHKNERYRQRSYEFNFLDRKKETNKNGRRIILGY